MYFIIKEFVLKVCFLFIGVDKSLVFIRNFQILKYSPDNELRLIDARVEKLISTAFNLVEIKCAETDWQLYRLLIVKLHDSVVVILNADRQKLKYLYPSHDSFESNIYIFESSKQIVDPQTYQIGKGEEFFLS